MVLELIDKVILRGDPSLDKARPAGISEITTRNGEKYSLRVDYPRGHARNPMTDEEIVDKFRNMASNHMSDEQMQQITEALFDLENLDDIGDLIKLMDFRDS